VLQKAGITLFASDADVQSRAVGGASGVLKTPSYHPGRRRLSRPVKSNFMLRRQARA
jgi:hypothetical protein